MPENHALSPLVEVEARRGRIHLRMTAQFMGQDLSVTLSGGDRPHIGAVALGAPHTSPSALSLPRHREGELAQRIAARLAAEFHVAVCVACGVHLEGISPEEIQDVLAMADALTHELSAHLEALPPALPGKQVCPPVDR